MWFVVCFCDEKNLRINKYLFFFIKIYYFVFLVFIVKFKHFKEYEF